MLGPHAPLPADLYAAKVKVVFPCGPFRQDDRIILPKLIQSRGPWLANGLFCPIRSSLTMASSEALVPSAALSPSSSRTCPATWSGLAPRASPIYSVCLSLRAVFRTPAFRMAAYDRCFTTRTGLRHFRIGSAPAIPHRRFSWGRVTRLQSSFYTTARRLACPTPTRAFTFELAPPESPTESVEYNYTGKQSTPVTGLSPARHTALWAANEDTK